MTINNYSDIKKRLIQICCVGSMVDFACPSEEDEFDKGQKDFSGSLPELKAWKSHVEKKEYEYESVSGVPDIHDIYSAYLYFKQAQVDRKIPFNYEFKTIKEFSKWYNSATADELKEKFKIWDSYR